MQVVFDFLKSKGRRQTTKEITAAIGWMHRESVRQAISALVVARVVVGYDSDDGRAYALAEGALRPIDRRGKPKPKAKT